jgi:hypothetical protein
VTTKGAKDAKGNRGAREGNRGAREERGGTAFHWMGNVDWMARRHRSGEPWYGAGVLAAIKD